MIETVVSHQDAVRLTARCTALFFIDLFEKRALIPGHSLVRAERSTKLLLRNVHKPDFKHFVRFSIADEMVQAAPGTFEGFEILVMHNQINLLAELMIDFSDHSLPGAENV